MTPQTATILKGPDQYYSWFSDIKESVPRDLWEYFDPETTNEFPCPELVTFSTVKEGAQSFQQLSTAERTLFAQLHALYHADLTQYHRFLSEEVNLRTLIHHTVSEAK